MMIQLVKLAEFGKGNEIKKEGVGMRRKGKILSHCSCPETDALRGDLITALHSDFKAGHGTYRHYTFFFLICIKQLPPWSVATELSRQHASDGIDDLRCTRLALN